MVDNDNPRYRANYYKPLQLRFQNNLLIAIKGKSEMSGSVPITGDGAHRLE
jgi:hypothetical protein